MSSFLKPSGYLVIDVNNRYNQNHYGIKTTVKNIIKDILKISQRGYYTLSESFSKSLVYIHNPWEIDQIAKQCSLNIVSKEYVDYTTGALKHYFWQGQTFYLMQKK